MLSWWLIPLVIAISYSAFFHGFLKFKSWPWIVKNKLFILKETKFHKIWNVPLKSLKHIKNNFWLVCKLYSIHVPTLCFIFSQLSLHIIYILYTRFINWWFYIFDWLHSQDAPSTVWFFSQVCRLEDLSLLDCILSLSFHIRY